MFPKALSHLNSICRNHLLVSSRAGLSSSCTEKYSMGNALPSLMDTEMEDKKENTIESCTVPSGTMERTHNTSNNDEISKPQVIRKKNYALVLSFCGANYRGYAVNRNVETIEQYVLKALMLAGYATEKEILNARYHLRYNNVSRTDRGVSAVQFLINMKFASEPDLEAINHHAPKDIRFMASHRVTQTFDCQKMCDARTYSYIVPTFALSPYKLDYKYNRLQDYRIDADTLYKVHDLLQFFQGSHRFHNYTSGKAMEDPSSRRYIFTISCSQPHLVGDLEFVEISVKGQSFMLHQIRKMVGMLLAVMRGVASFHVIPDSFTKPRLGAPTAPSLGLFLEKPHFDFYNRRYGHQLPPLNLEDHNLKCNEFKYKHILPHIMGTEISEGVMIDWLKDKLRYHSFHPSEEKQSKYHF